MVIDPKYMDHRGYTDMVKARAYFNAKPSQCVVIGDQIFTDIYGGLRMNFHTVLVTAVGENETKFVAFKRIFEKAVMEEYYRKPFNTVSSFTKKNKSKKS